MELNRKCSICGRQLTTSSSKTCGVECRKTYARQYQRKRYLAEKSRTKKVDVNESTSALLAEYKSRGLTLNRLLVLNCEIDFFNENNVCILCASKPIEKSLFCSDTCRKRFLELASRAKKNQIRVYVRKNTQIIVNLDKDFEASIVKYNQYEKQRNSF